MCALHVQGNVVEVERERENSAAAEPKKNGEGIQSERRVHKIRTESGKKGNGGRRRNEKRVKVGEQRKERKLRSKSIREIVKCNSEKRSERKMFYLRDSNVNGIGSIGGGK